MNIAFFSAVRYDSFISGRTRRLCDELSRRHTIHFIEMPSLRHPCMCCQKKVNDNIFRYQLTPFPRLWHHLDSACGHWWNKYAAFFLNRFLPADTHAVVSTPFWSPLLEMLNFKSITYDCLDHISVQAPGKLTQTASQLEKQLLSKADRIVCVSNNLCDAIKTKTDKPVYNISNGFPADYLQAWTPLPEKPTAGFCGAMYEWFDFSLIRDTAAALPDVKFILTGPVRNAGLLNPLKKLSNIEINPAIAFEQVKSEISRYSIGLVPFNRDLISFYCDPIKLYEYSALGRTVVSTVKGNDDLPVLFAEDKQTFIAEVDRLVHTPEMPQSVPDSLEKYTWTNIAGDFESILE